MFTRLASLTHTLIAALALFFGIIVAAWASAPAHSQTVPKQQQMTCYPKDVVFRVLQEELKMTPGIIGLTTDGNMLILFTAKDGASWAAGVMTPDKVVCLVAEGTDLQSILPDIKVGRPA